MKNLKYFILNTRYRILFFVAIGYFLLASGFLLITSGYVFATDYSGSTFIIRDPVISDGGNRSTSNNFELYSSVGNLAIGTSSSSGFKLNSGFLFYPLATKPTMHADTANGEARLYWTPAKTFLGWSLGGYNIGRATASGGPYTYSSVGSTTHATRTGLTNGTTYYFVVRVEDALGNNIATSSEVAVVPSSSIENIFVTNLPAMSATTTSFVLNNQKCDVALPAAAAAADLFITSSSTSKSSLESSMPIPSGKVGGSTFFHFLFEKMSDLSKVSSFSQAITLTFTYTDSEVSGIDESTLVPHRWNGSSWVALSNVSVNTSANTVSATTQQFSYVALIGTAPASSPPPAPPPPTTGGGLLSLGAAVSGGGGGGGGGVAEPSTVVLLKGRAYPYAQLNVFKDGSVVSAPKADKNGLFEVKAAVGGGLYTFSVYAVDAQNRRSLTSSFTVNAPRDVATTVSDIVVAPTINADKSAVKYGNDITFYGYTYPQSQVEVTVNSEEPYVDATEADKTGYWDYALNSKNLERGSHTTKTQATTPDGVKSPVSESIAFSVGDVDVLVAQAAKKPLAFLGVPASTACSKQGDINNDKKINVVDFSILLFFWNQRDPQNPCADINGDGVVNLSDFSIMLFWWTG